MADITQSTRILNSKKRVMVFATLILGVQIGEALFSREDFPFTQWGMYKSFHGFEPYADIFFEKNGQRITQKVFGDPWTVRRGILQILEIPDLERMSPAEIAAAHNKVLVTHKDKKHEISSFLKKNFFASVSPEDIQVKFKYWGHLTYENRWNPESELTLYGDNQ